MRAFLFIASLLIGFSCTEPSTESTHEKGGDSADTSLSKHEAMPLDQPPSVENSERTGLLWYENGQAKFAPAYAPDDWVYLDTEAYKQMQGTYHKHLPKLTFEGEPILVTLRAEKTGQAEDSREKIHVTQVVSAKQHTYFDTKFPFEYWAMGNEPFWSAEVSPQRNQIIVKSLANYQVNVYPYVPSTQEGEELVYRLEAAGKPSGTLRIRQQDCTDDMSGKPFNHRAALSIGDIKGQGCATTFEKQ